MSFGFVLLGVAVFGLIAAVISAVIGATFWLGQSRLARLAPAAQARLLLAAAFLPAFAALAFLSGWVTDLVVLRCTAHHCVDVHGFARPGSLVLALALAPFARIVWAVGRGVLGVARVWVMRRRLNAAAAHGSDGVRVLPAADAQAFVVGLLQPQIYVSQGLLRTDCADSVLAHERAHQRRRDPLRRLVASLGLAVHLPGVARLLDHQLARAQELAADADAARAVGDAPRIAQAVVRFARLRLARPATAVGWQGGDLEARVCALLADDTGPDQPPQAVLIAALIAMWCGALVAADPLHSLAEILLGWLD